MYYVYMLLCRGDSLYTGITPDLKHRMRQHMGQIKGGARFTALRPPQEIAALWTCPDRSTASKAEYAIKTLSPTEKRQLTADPALLTTLLPRLDGLELEPLLGQTLEALLK